MPFLIKLILILAASLVLNSISNIYSGPISPSKVKKPHVSFVKSTSRVVVLKGYYYYRTEEGNRTKYELVRDKQGLPIREKKSKNIF